MQNKTGCYFSLCSFCSLSGRKFLEKVPPYLNTVHCVFGAITGGFLFAHVFNICYLIIPDAFQYRVKLKRKKKSNVVWWHKKVLHVVSDPVVPHLPQALETGHILTGRSPEEVEEQRWNADFKSETRSDRSLTQCEWEKNWSNDLILVCTHLLPSSW